MRNIHLHLARTAWAALLLFGGPGCERSALPAAVPAAGELPTPRVESAPAPTAAPTPTSAVLPTPTLTLSIPRTPTPLIDDLDAAAIRRLEPGGPALVESGRLLPFYRANRELRRYQTAAWTYLIDPRSHQIVEILPVEETAVLGGSPLTPAALEQAARLWVQKAAPAAALDGLLANHSTPSANYLYRWEDHTRAPLEDGRSYPFIQVALSSSGQLLNYFNTLPLAEP